MSGRTQTVQQGTRWIYGCGGYFGGYDGLSERQPNRAELTLSKDVLLGHFNIAQVDELQVKLMQLTINHHHNHHQLSLSSSQPPSSVTTTIICYYQRHNHHHLSPMENRSIRWNNGEVIWKATEKVAPKTKKSKLFEISFENTSTISKNVNLSVPKTKELCHYLGVTTGSRKTVAHNLETQLNSDRHLLNDLFRHGMRLFIKAKFLCLLIGPPDFDHISFYGLYRLIF